MAGISYVEKEAEKCVMAADDVGEGWVPDPTLVGRRCAHNLGYMQRLPKSSLVEDRSLEGRGADEMMRFHQI